MPKHINGVYLTCCLFLISFCVNASSVNHFDISKQNIHSLTTMISQKEITCEQVIASTLNRIKKYNLDISRGAAINAFTAINPLALDTARAMDNQFNQTQQLVGALHCVPVIVKDNIDTIDTPSTSGTFALLGSQPIQDAFLVEQLKKAGAIIVGKGNMDELAFGAIGISGRLGRTGNAFDPTQNPGGSSGGPAAAVSAGFALIGIGTDNSGSIRIPAAFNGIFGLRPSTGLISQSGIFPRGSLDGVAGPLTRSVDDMAIVLSVMSQPDHKKDYQALLTKKSLENMTIGLVKTVAKQDVYHDMPEDIHQKVQTFLQQLKTLGANIKSIDFPEFIIERDNNMAGEVEEINAYLNSFPSTRKSYDDICLSRRTMINIKDCLKHIKSTAVKGSEPYKNTLQMFDKNRAYVQQLMQKNNIDVLIAPISTKGTATYDVLSINTWKLPLSSNSGLPALAMTIGYSNEKPFMPISMQMIGKYLDEVTLLQIAKIIEKNSQPLRSPDLGNPKDDLMLSNLNIDEMNNFFSLLGMNTFKKFLWYHQAEELTPEIFNAILLNSAKEFVKT